MGMAAFPFQSELRDYVPVYAFITWLYSVNRHALFRVAHFWFSLCLTLLTDIVVDRLLVDFHESPKLWIVQNVIELEASVEKSYMILTASDYLWQNTCTKGGSFSWRRIESASKIDPGTDRIC